MRVDSKYLFYDGLPTKKDLPAIMADNGYVSHEPGYAKLPGVADVPGGHNDPIDVKGSINQWSSANDTGPDTHSFRNDPNSIIDYTLAGFGLADGLLPRDRIKRNYPTTPLPVYNPYPGGTGSQAIYDDGGYIEDEAKSGNWIKGAVNPKHKGYCTPMTKSTCTGHRRALAMTFKKHHGFHEAGGIISDPGNQFYHGNAATGGSISPDKAKEMLRDGTAHKHPLTDKQKRYFGYIAGGGNPNAAVGKELWAPGNGIDNSQADWGDPIKHPVVGINDVSGQSRLHSPFNSNASFSDLLSRNLVNTGDPNDLKKSQGVLFQNASSQYGPQKAAKLMDAVNIYNRRPEIQHYSPQQRIQSFYDMQSGDQDVQAIKNQYRNFGMSPVSMYNHTPDVANQMQQGSVASNKYGGYMENGGFAEGSIHDLPEEHIAHLLKKGYKIEYL